MNLVNGDSHNLGIDFSNMTREDYLTFKHMPSNERNLQKEWNEFDYTVNSDYFVLMDPKLPRRFDILPFIHGFIYEIIQVQLCIQHIKYVCVQFPKLLRNQRKENKGRK